jgi:hypothetical protein
MAAKRAIVALIAGALTRTAGAAPETVEEREALPGDPLPVLSFDEQLRWSGYTGIRYAVFRGAPGAQPDRHDALALGSLSLRLAREVAARLHALAAGQVQAPCPDR